jgi:probable HAF family extracellular repeat protein
VQGEGDRVHAMIWRNGVMEDLNPALEGQVEGRGINDADQVVGWAMFDFQVNIDRHAFLWEDGVMTDLGTLHGNQSEALAINNAGQIVGRVYDVDEGNAPPVIWENGIVRSLLPDSCEDCSGIAEDINNLGQIVGRVTIPEQNIKHYPVKWDADGTMTILYEGAGKAVCINSRGQIVGSLELGEGRAVRWEPDGTMVELEEGGPFGSVAIDINDHGVIIGGDGDRGDDIVIWMPDGRRVRLNYLTAPFNKWLIEIPREINNNNQIAARGRKKQGSAGKKFAFLVTPITPKFAITEPAPAIAGEMNEITAHGGALEPGMKVNFYWSTHGGGTMFPSSSCDILDAVLQLENAKWAGSAIADANGIATLAGTVPISAKDRYVLFQAVVPASETADGKCMQSPFSVVQFE